MNHHSQSGDSVQGSGFTDNTALWRQSPKKATQRSLTDDRLMRKLLHWCKTAAPGVLAQTTESQSVCSLKLHWRLSIVRHPFVCAALCYSLVCMKSGWNHQSKMPTFPWFHLLSAKGQLHSLWSMKDKCKFHCFAMHIWLVHSKAWFC